MNFDFVLTLDQQIMVGLGFLIIVFYFYVSSRFKEHTKKIHILAKSLGEVQRQIYEFEMRHNEKFKELHASKAGLSTVEVETLVDISATNHLIPIDQAIASLKIELDSIKDEFSHRISNVEGGMKEAALPRSTVGGADDKKILQLYNSGRSVEMIAKELHISAPEVEFALKLADLR